MKGRREMEGKVDEQKRKRSEKMMKVDEEVERDRKKDAE